MTIIKMCGLEIDIDQEPHHAESERVLLLRVLAQLKRNENKLNKIMISQESLNASGARLETAAATIIGLLPGNTVPSTPDTIVAAFQGRVDGASAAMEAAAATASTGTTGT